MYSEWYYYILIKSINKSFIYYLFFLRRLFLWLLFWYLMNIVFSTRYAIWFWDWWSFMFTFFRWSLFIYIGLWFPQILKLNLFSFLFNLLLFFILHRLRNLFALYLSFYRLCWPGPNRLSRWLLWKYLSLFQMSLWSYFIAVCCSIFIINFFDNFILFIKWLFYHPAKWIWTLSFFKNLLWWNS